MMLEVEIRKTRPHADHDMMPISVTNHQHHAENGCYLPSLAGTIPVMIVYRLQEHSPYIPIFFVE